MTMFEYIINKYTTFLTENSKISDIRMRSDKKKYNLIISVSWPESELNQFFIQI